MKNKFYKMLKSVLLWQIVGGLIGGLVVGGMVAMAASQTTVPVANGPGQLLQSTSTGAYVATSLNAGSGITLATTTNSITISSSGSSGSPFPFTPTLNFGVTTSATSTPISDFAGIYASSTSQFAQASTTNISSNGSAYFAITGGKVAVGATTTPTYLFTVGGATGDTTGNGYFTGNVIANNFYDLTLGGTTCVGESAGLLNNSNCVQSVASAGGTLTVSSPTGAVDVSLNLAHSNTWSVLQTFGNATTTNISASNELNVPHGSTVPGLSAGDIYQNTNSTASSSIQTSESSLFNVHSVSTVLASSTLVYMGSFGATSSTTLPIVNALHKTTIQSFFCTTDKGTALVDFGTGFATTTYAICSATGGVATSLSNNVFNGRQLIKMDIGTSASSPNTITVTADVEDSN